MATITGIDKRITSFLDLIAFSEGTSTNALTKNNGYDMLVTDINGPASFSDYSSHPLLGKPERIVRQIPIPRLLSTAAGRYQVLLRIWNYYSVSLRLPDFSPVSQDKIALELMHERHADTMLLANDVYGAIKACNSTWASFPGNNYGQGGKSLDVLLAKYDEFVAS